MKPTFLRVLSLISLAWLSIAHAGEVIEFQTNLDSTIDHPNIVIRISDAAIPAADATTILAGFEQAIASGVRYQAGESIQVGFIINEFVALADGRLLLVEPDMVSLPIAFVPHMDFTLRTLRNQKDIVESTDVPLNITFTTVSEAIAVHKDFATAEALMLARSEPEGLLSGWWLFHPTDDDPNNYLWISLYEFAQARPDLVKFLALPPHSEVLVIKDEPLQLFYHEQALPIAKRSYVEALNKLR
uniref:immunity protein Imm33 domain-containing protein n=1 Tax=Thaumasiovibrio occultus TaxID=1891184 RepID=UPI000B35B17E|nr:hypothetical protein [Thaumasiovibrio occultus]